MPVKAHKASDYLRSSEDAAAYLNAALEETRDDPRPLVGSSGFRVECE